MGKFKKRKIDFVGSNLLNIANVAINLILKLLLPKSFKNNLNFPKRFKYVYIYRSWGEDTSVVKYNIESLSRHVGQEKLLVISLTVEDNIVKKIKELFSIYEFEYLLLDTRVMVYSAYWYQIPSILISSRLIANLAYSYNVKVMCQSLDFYQPSDRVISSLLTSNEGVVISLATEPELKYFPHRRVIGPCPVGLYDSKSRKKLLIERKWDVFLGGLLYGKRQSLYSKLYDELSKSGIKCLLLKKEEVKNYSDYLSILGESKIVVTTNFFSNSPNKIQMNGKSIEATLEGAILVAQKSSALNAFYRENIDYVSFTDLDDISELVNKIIHLLEDHELSQSIANSGANRAYEFFSKNITWSLAENTV